MSNIIPDFDEINEEVVEPVNVIPERLQQAHKDVVESFIPPRASISSSFKVEDVHQSKPSAINRRLIMSGVGALVAGVVIYAAFQIMKPKAVFMPVAGSAASLIPFRVVSPAPAAAVAVQSVPVAVAAPVVAAPAPVDALTAAYSVEKAKARVRKPVVHHEYHERKLDAATLEGLRLLN